MKTMTKCLLGLLGVVVAMSVSVAQDYKHPYGMVQEDGKVLDGAGKHLGWVTKEGIIKDTLGMEMVHIDAEGSAVVHKTGKKIGKVRKNGNYVSHYAKTSGEKGWTTSPPMSGMCEVKNSKGELVVMVHVNYKQYGACAYHCLSMEKDKKYMKM
jgi:hypothetical protein